MWGSVIKDLQAGVPYPFGVHSSQPHALGAVQRTVRFNICSISSGGGDSGVFSHTSFQFLSMLLVLVLGLGMFTLHLLKILASDFCRSSQLTVYFDSQKTLNLNF